MDGGELKINMEHDYMIIDHFPSTQRVRCKRLELFLHVNKSKKKHHTQMDNYENNLTQAPTLKLSKFET